jgi:ABC-type cobalamin transport system ATPase subunit
MKIKNSKEILQYLEGRERVFQNLLNNCTESDRTSNVDKVLQMINIRDELHRAIDFIKGELNE